MLDAYSFNKQKYGQGSTELLQIDTRGSIIVDLADEGKKILDIGCGNGEIGSLLIGNENEVYGVDVSMHCVKEAKSNGLTTKQCDIEKDAIPFKTKFDLIIAGEIIEHIFDTEGFLKKLHSKLNKDGELIITTPNIAALGRRLMLLAGKNPHLEPSANTKYAGHIRYFTKDLLVGLLEESGFKVTVFASDAVNFNSSGHLRSEKLAKIFPTLGRSLIIKCEKA